MSHEIRTPMTAVLGYTDLLLDRKHGITNPDEVAEAVMTIKRNGTYLLELVNDILDLSKIEAGRLTVESVRVSPVELLADVRRLMGVRAQAQGLAFHLDLGTNVPETIETDPTRLRQIIVNLVGNAIKFTESGSVSLRMLEIERDGNPWLQFSIEDTGIGMTQEQLTRVFQPFTQADSSTTRQYGGTGLGLTISTRLTQLLGGVLEADSEADRGSCFRISVPTGPLDGVARIADPLEWLEHRTPETDTTGKIGRLDCRVLVAEDGVDNQRLIRAILTPRVREIVLAENGQVAFELAMNAVIDGRPFDVILMDMQMPVLDGYEATRRLRMNGYEGPILALTAHAMEGNRDRCLEAGCDDFATKPINRTELLEKIARLTNKRRPEDDLPQV
jgi:CheY-like chemotaxis protein